MLLSLSRRAAGWIVRGFRRAPVILVYHRVATLGVDPWELAVQPRHFAEHLEVLRRYMEPLALRELIQHLRKGTLPPRAAVVTFDDGYLDNLEQAKPLLERHGVPATVFVVPGAAETGGELWWDELEALLLQPPVLPAEICIALRGTERTWKLREAPEPAADAAPSGERAGHWRAWDPAHTARQRAYRELWEVLHASPPEEREAILPQLRLALGVERPRRATHRLLAEREIVELGADGLVEIGAHTLTHPSLAALPPDRQRHEIEGSRRRLEEVLGKPVTSFAYPFGKPHDYTAGTVALLRDAGFSCACTTTSARVGRGVDPYRLPRITVPDVDGDTLMKLIAFSRSASGARMASSR